MELPPMVRDLQLPLLFVTSIVTLGFKPSPGRWLFSLPVVLLLVLQSLYPKEEDYYGDRYSFGCLALQRLFTHVDWIYLSSPDKDKWHKVKDAKDDSKSDVVPQTFLARLWWGIRMTTTQRYVGWSNQVKNVPVEVTLDYPKWRFIVRKLLRAALMLVLADAASSYTAGTPHGSFRGYEKGKVYVGLDGLPLSRQFFFSWTYVWITYTSIELLNAVYGIVAVATGLSQPRECPSAFGDLKEAYTVRNAWSVVWHQNCRRACSAPGVYLARDVLRLRRGSFASKYFQLFSGFFVSACIHGVAAMLCHRSMDDGYSFAVFMAQAAAIMVEDHIIEFGRLLGLKPSWIWKCVGYVWVFLWTGFSIKPWASAAITDGIWNHTPQIDFFGLGPAKMKVV